MIREVTRHDVDKLASLIQQVERESDFMLFEADERIITPEQQLKRIESMQNEENSTIIVAEVDHQLVGYLVAIGGSANRNKYSVYIVIGVLSEFAGQGVGTKMFEALLNWAVKQKIHRLELTVMKHNVRAVALYKKMGFEIEGIKRDSLYLNGKFVDEYYMGRII